MTNSVVIPESRFAPERLAKKLLPCSWKACSIMRALVVLPLVPVMATVVTPRARTESRFGQIFSAQRPGMAVPPRWSTREKKRRNLHKRMAKNMRTDISILLVVSMRFDIISQCIPPGK